MAKKVTIKMPKVKSVKNLESTLAKVKEANKKKQAKVLEKKKIESLKKAIIAEKGKK